ncbi:MAG TPA: hypothetical protein VJT80_13505 [Steroidobacteraceae bacterium]|nr:hypothetical protein [Steroidobacteraceae bacterium]
MSSDQAPSSAPTHAELFGDTSRALMAGALEFARGVRQTFTPDEVARMYLGVGAWLAAASVGKDRASTMLRELAEGIEAGTPYAN